MNAGVFFAVGSQLIEEAYDRRWAAALTLGLAAFYTAHVYYFLRRRLVDRELLVSFIGLAAFFLAMTMPLLLSAEWVTASWAIQAVVLVWIAGKIGSEFVRHVAYVLFAVVMARFCYVDLQNQFLQAPPAAGLPWTAYVQELVERVLSFGIPIGSLAVAYRMLAKQAATEEKVVDQANDIQPWLGGTLAGRLMVVAAVVSLFLYLDLELGQTLGFFYEPAQVAGAHAGLAGALRADPVRVPAMGQLVAACRSWGWQCWPQWRRCSASMCGAGTLRWISFIAGRIRSAMPCCGWSILVRSPDFWRWLMRSWRDGRRRRACGQCSALPAWRCYSSI